MKKLQSHSAPPAPVLCHSLGQNFHQLQLSSELQLGTPLICWVFNDASANAPGNDESDLQAVHVLPDRRSLLLPAQAKPQSHFTPCDFSLHVAGSRFLTQAEMSYMHKTWRKALGSVPWWIKWSSNRGGMITTELLPDQADCQEASGVSRKDARLPGSHL